MKLLKDKSSPNNNQINLFTFIIKKLIMLLAIFGPIYVYIMLSNMINDTQEEVFFMIKNMGEMAINSLYIVIFSGPLYKLLADNIYIIKLKLSYILKFFIDIRPELGFYMGAMAIGHGVFTLLGLMKINLWMWPTDFSYLGTWAIWSGIITVIIIIPMFLTSNRWAIKILGPIWFKIHSLIVYVVFFGVFHAELIRARDNSITEIIPFIIIMIAYFSIRYLAAQKSKQMTVIK